MQKTISGRSSFLALALLLIGPDGAYADVSKWKTVGTWDVSFYDKVPGCLASASYDGGISFFIGFELLDNKNLLRVSLANESWTSLENGKEYPIKVYFGDETPWNLEMGAELANGLPILNFWFNASSEQSNLFLEEFQRELNMEWFFSGVSLGNLSLRGSKLAIDATLECQKSFIQAVSNVEDPFGNRSNVDPSDPFDK